MGGGAVGGAVAGAIAAQAAIAQALRASGAIVHLEPEDFRSIVPRTKAPLVVVAQSGRFKTNYQYLTGYKGLVLFTKSPAPLPLPGDVELIKAKKIWIPD